MMFAKTTFSKAFSKALTLLLSALMLLTSLSPAAFAARNDEGAPAPIVIDVPNDDSGSLDVDEQYIEDKLNAMTFALDAGSLDAITLMLNPTEPSTPSAADTLSFKGGSASGDVYSINLGAYVQDGLRPRIPFTIYRPNAAGYAVSVDFTTSAGSAYDHAPGVYASASTEDYQNIYSVTFLGGETQKTVYIEPPNATFPWNGTAVAYLDFHTAYRTKTAQRTVELRWSSSGDTMASYPATQASVTLPSAVYVENNAATVPISVYFGQPIEITSDLRLVADVPDGESVSLSAAEPAGTKTVRATFLYSLTEAALGTPDVWDASVINGNTTELLTVTAFQNVKSVADGSVANIQADEIDGGNGLNKKTTAVVLSPRYGDVQSGKSSYTALEPVTLTVQVQNHALLEAFEVYKAAEVGDWLRVTTNGGVSLALGSAVMAGDGTVTLSFNAPVISSASETVYAELIELDPDGVATARYGKYAALAVSKGELGDIVPVTGITINDLPLKQNILLDGETAFDLTAAIEPANATFQTVSWSSDNPGVVSVTADGRIKALKSGVAIITATSDEAAYRKQNKLAANDEVLISSVRIIVGDAKPELVPTAWYDDKIWTSSDTWWLHIPISDNFDFAAPADPDDYQAFLDGLTYTITVTDAKGNNNFGNISGKPPADKFDSTNPNPQLYFDDANGSGLVTFACTANKFTPPNDYYDNPQPAFTAVVTAHFGDGSVFQDSTQTYYVYAEQRPLTSGLTEGNYYESFVSNESPPPLTWEVQNLVDDNYSLGFSIFRSVNSPYDPDYNPRNCAKSTVTDDGTVTETGDRNAAGHIETETWSGNLLTGIIELDASYIYSLVASAEKLWLRICFWALNTATGERVEEWVVYEVTSATSENVVSLTLFKKEHRLGFEKHLDLDLIDDLQAKYTAYKDDPLKAPEFFEWLNNTTAVTGVEFNAPDEWGLPTFNGVTLQNPKSFHLAMPQSGKSALRIEWPQVGFKYPIVVNFNFDYEDLYLFDLGRQFTKPVNIYAMYGTGQKALIATHTPYDGRIALMPSLETDERTAGFAEKYGLFFETEDADGAAWSGWFSHAEKLRYTGVTPADAPLGTTEDVLISQQAADTGSFIVNTVTLSREHNLLVSTTGGINGFAYAVIDENGTPIEDYKWSLNPTDNYTFPVPYLDLLTNEDTAYLILETSMPNHSSRLEILTREQLLELIPANLPNNIPYHMESHLPAHAGGYGGNQPQFSYAQLTYEGLRNGGANGELDRVTNTVDLFRNPLLYGQVALDTRSSDPKLILATRGAYTQYTVRAVDAQLPNEAYWMQKEILPDSYITTENCLFSSYRIAVYDLSRTMCSTNELGAGRAYSSLSIKDLSNGGLSALSVNLTTTNDSELRDNRQRQALEAAERQTHIDPPAIETHHMNNTSGIESVNAQSGFNAFKSGYGSLPFEFRVTKVPGKENEFEIRAAMRVVSSMENLVGDFVNTMSDKTSDAEFQALIDEVRGVQEKGGIKVTLGIEAPITFESSFKGYILAKGYYDPVSMTMTIEMQEGALVSYSRVGFEIDVPIAEIMFIGFGMSGEFGANAYMWAPDPSDLAKMSPNYAGITYDSALETKSAITLSVSGGIGVDFKIVSAKIGVKGTGTMERGELTVTRPYLPTTDSRYKQSGIKYKATTSLSTFTKVSFLCFAAGAEFVMVTGEKSWYDPDSTTNPYKDPTIPFSDTYVKPFNLIGNLQNPLIAPMALVVPTSAATLVGTVHSSATAQYWADGVLYNDLGALNNYDDDRVGNTGMATWTYPFNGEGGDFAFDTATKNGNSVAAWEHVKSSVMDLDFVDPALSLRSMAAQTEIVAAVYDGTDWSAPVKLTDNQLMDMAPAAAVSSDGKATVIWSRGLIDEGENLNNLLNLQAATELCYATYDGNIWSASKALYRPQQGKSIADYSVARGDDGSFMVALALSDGVKRLYEIVYIYVSSSGDSYQIGTTMRGFNPQVICVGSDYYTGFYSEVGEVDSQDCVRDIWFGKFVETITEAAEDNPTAPTLMSLQGLAPLGASADLGADFRFTDAVNTFDDLGIVWPAASVDSQGSTQLSLKACKLVEASGSFSLSQPVSLDAGENEYIGSYDAVIKGTAITAAMVIVDGDDATVIQVGSTFTNEVLADVKYTRSDVAPEAALPMTFVVRNDGYQPITKLTVTIGSDTVASADNLCILPGETYSLQGRCWLPDTLPNTLSYSLSAVFASGSKMATGTIALETSDLKIEATDMTGDVSTGGTITFAASSLSAVSLPAGASVTMGLYSDIEGNTPVAAEITLSADDIQRLNDGGTLTASFNYAANTNSRLYGMVEAKLPQNASVWDVNPSNNVYPVSLNAIDNPKMATISSGSAFPSASENTTDVNGLVVTTTGEREPVKQSDGSYTLPGGGVIITPDGTRLTVPAGTTISKDAEVTLPQSAGGTLTLPGGASFTIPSGTAYRTQSGELLLPSGKSATVTLPSGICMTLSEDVIIITDPELPLGYWLAPETMPVDVQEDDWFWEFVQFAYAHGLMSGTDEVHFSPDNPLSRAMIVTVLYRLAGSPDASALPDNFKDTDPKMYYADAIRWAAKLGIVNGYGDGRFGPDDNISRQDLAVILMRYADIAGLTLPTERLYELFTDAADISDYARDAVEACYAGGVVNGREVGIFDPGGEATRAEFAAMLYRLIVKAV